MATGTRKLIIDTWGGTSFDYSRRCVTRTGTGRIYVTYTMGALTDAGQDLRLYYTDDDGDTWSYDTVVVAGAYKWINCLCIDSDEQLHIIYRSDATTVKYVTGQIDSWSTPATVGTLHIYDMALDSADMPHVLCMTLNGNYDITHYWLDGTWQSEAVAGEAYNLLDPMVCVDDADGLHVTYVKQSSPFPLVHRTKPSGGSWSAESTVLTNTGNAPRNYVVVDTAGVNLHAVGEDSDPGEQYNKRTGSSWGSEDPIVDTAAYPGDFPAMLADDEATIWVMGNDNIFQKLSGGSWDDLEDVAQTAHANSGYCSVLWSRWPVVGGENICVPETGVIGVYHNYGIEGEMGMWLYLNDNSYPLSEAPVFMVEVDWNNDGDFSDTYENITADVRMAPGYALEWERGIEEELEHPGTGTMQLTVNNDDGKYSPENTGSVIYPYVLPYRAIRLRIRVGGITYEKFRGYIEKYTPHPRSDEQSVDLLCVDGLDLLARTQIEAPSGGVQTDVLIGDAPGPLKSILDTIGWNDTRRTLDAGVDTLAHWWAHAETALAAKEKLEDCEKSMMLVDGKGYFVYEDRHHRLKSPHLTSQATFSDTMVTIDYEFAARSVYNKLQAKGAKRTAAATAKLWGTRDRPLVGPGAALTVWAILAAPAESINAPEEIVDWKANSAADGSGADETTNVALVSTVYGQSVKMVFTNSAGYPVYIIPGTVDADYAMYIDGDAYEEDKVFAESEDATSITAYGERGLSIDTVFKESMVGLTNYADWLKARYKDPVADAVRMHLVNRTTALYVEILAREISDRVTLTVTALGITTKDYFINKMRHIIDRGGKRHRCIFSIGRIEGGEGDAFWILGEAGYSELEETTRLAF